MKAQAFVETHERASLDFQREQYRGRHYRKLRKLRWLFRHDCHYRLFLMEDLFRKNNIPFERQRVYELGFGYGDLLLRFGRSCSIHGCESSPDAIEELYRDPRTQGYQDLVLVPPEPSGHPRFPSNCYDIVIASHVLEHVPDDRETLKLLSSHTRTGGWGLFFLPLEPPCYQAHHHVRIYSEAGFERVLRKSGWEPVVVEENLRYDFHITLALKLLEKQRTGLLFTLLEAAGNILATLPPRGILHLAEGPLKSLYVPARQLMVLAQNGP